MIRAALIALLCAAPLPALAHKVLASVFPSGSAIEGEIGLSNGDMAQGLEITVTGPDGGLLGRTVTDQDGFFLFTPTQAVSHTFYGNMGSGHVAKITMPEAEVAAIMGQTVPAPAPETPDAPTARVTVRADTREAIAQIVRDEIRPLRREIVLSREEQDFQSILGGIGYIVGLFGLGFYIAARRKLADAG
ncbi:hypothetical protein [Tropicibacter naphthalenivorans]|uniref:Nickel uptake substrate-specific transmembrane region n=1 Tax=Tropicibacter naphthalenivorans TaxID=441103 RepID=A0A0P1GH06_9RHOB|nr:hypothetical protein [Tropicibacter naphthalenivorans]CUH80805.1 hypothetical protein TRN7648_03174 [Tropicibacter naphthalenivorans]SMC90324.1 nickel transport protein [Tropicibacter naphthalenivorans]